MSQLEKDDIQGIVLRSFGTRRSARYIFLTIEDVDKARQWIGEIKGDITHGHYKAEDEEDHGEDYLNIGFSLSGLRKLNVPVVQESLNGSFQAGPLNQHTLRMLGDSGINDPSNWSWGNEEIKTEEKRDPEKEEKKVESPIHIILLAFSKSDAGLDDFCNDVRDEQPDCPFVIANTIVVTGHPVDQIVHHAEKMDTDLIIMGSRGRGGLADATMGSTSRRVLRRCSKPALIVRLPEDENR